MTPLQLQRRALRGLFPLLVIVALGLAGAGSAAAFQIKPATATNLDGKVVLSPAAERIETTNPDGGAPIEPGSVVRRTLILQNRARRATDFDLDVAQVVGAGAEDVVEVRHGVREGAASWVTLERTTVRLRPGETAFILVTVRVPRSVKPGSKPFAVTATQRGGTIETQGAGVTPIFRQVAIFIVELPGDAPIEGRVTRAQVTSASDTLRRAGERKPRKRTFFVGRHRLTLDLEYRNEGERLLRPTGRVEVRDIFGRLVHTYKVDDFTVYPAGSNARSVELRKLPSLGLYRARLTLESDAGQQTRALGWWLLMPWWTIAALAAVLLLGLFWTARAWWEQRQYARWAQDATAGDDAGEDLDDEGYDEDGFDDFVEDEDDAATNA